MAIYSTLLFCGDVTTTRTALYQPPNGITTVVRDLELVNNGNATTVFIAIQPASGFNGNFWVPTFSSSSWSSLQWVGRVVLPAGAQLFASTTAGTATLTAMGYELSA